MAPAPEVVNRLHLVHLVDGLGGVRTWLRAPGALGRRVFKHLVVGENQGIFGLDTSEPRIT